MYRNTRELIHEPRGDIVTVLDLTDRDAQDDFLFPLDADTTLFTVDRDDKKPMRRTPAMQIVGARGNPGFGNRFIFDLNPSQLPDMIHAVSLQIDLDHWIPASVRARIADGRYSWPTVTDNIWCYANGLGISIIEEASFEVGDLTVDRLTGEFIAAWLAGKQELAAQVALTADCVGLTAVAAAATPAVFPVENGILTCILPFFFQRYGERTSFPLVSCKEGDVRVIIKLRPFEQVVRQLRGWRDSCKAVPAGSQELQTAGGGQQQVPVQTGVPVFKNCHLTVYGSYIDLSQRSKYIKLPHELQYRHLYINTFSEPLSYAVGNGGRTINFLLPLELNGPVEKLVWVLRRKAAVLNNDWVTFGPALPLDYTVWGATKPVQFDDPVVEARILLNGIETMKKSGYELRNMQADSTVVSADNWIYQYSFSSMCIEGNGYFNASRIQTIQLALTVRNTMEIPSGVGGDFNELNGWEIFVFGEGVNWLRFQNTQVGRIFQ